MVNRFPKDMFLSRDTWTIYRLRKSPAELLGRVYAPDETPENHVGC